MHVSGPKALCQLDLYQSFDVKDHSRLTVTAEEAISFYEKGFFTCAGAVDPSLIRRSREYIDQNYYAWQKISKRQDDWRMHYMHDWQIFSTTPIEHAPILDMVLNSPTILSKVEHLMGCRPIGSFYNQVAYRTPLANYKPSLLDYQAGAEYHIDGQANAQGTRFPDPWSVVVGIALVDIEVFNMGNFTVFPGYHSKRTWFDYPEEKKTKTLPDLGEPYRLSLTAGSAFFAHVLLPHRGGKNILTPEEIDRSGIDYEGILNIPHGTREMALFRVQGAGIDYTHPDRSRAVLSNPWHEHQPVIDLLDGIGYLKKDLSCNIAGDSVDVKGIEANT